MRIIETVFAQASRITGKGGETVATSGAAVSDFFNTFWDKLDNWIAALVVMGISMYLANLFRKIAVDKIAEHVDEEHQDVLVLAGRATYVVVLGLGITIALKVVGIDVTSIVAAFGLGVGFAMKDLLMNFMAGILLMIARNYTIGDYIQVNNTFGQIVEIQGRATILRMLDGTKAIIPNAELFTNQVISFTSNPFRRIEINVGVEYEADLRTVVEIAKKVLEENKNIIQEPKPAVLVAEFGESSINLVLRFWVDSRSNWWEIKSQTMMELKKVFDTANITIPWPIRTLDFKDEHAKKMAREISKNFESNVNTNQPIQNLAEIPPENVEQPQNTTNTVPEKKEENSQKKPKDTGAAFLEKVSPSVIPDRKVASGDRS